MKEICIIIPCYNEARRFPREEFNKFYQHNKNICFCFVDDGSMDNTYRVLSNLCKGKEKRSVILSLPRNSGKAEAVRQGILNALAWKSFDLVGYFDADLSTPLEEIPHLLEAITKSNCSIACGCRIKKLGSNIKRNPWRHYLGRVFATMVSISLNLPVYDTQCGAKLIKTSLAHKIFKEKFISRWIFDVEIFFRVINLFGKENVYKEIIEVPLDTWIDKGHSKLKLNDFLKGPLELLRIYRTYKSRTVDKLTIFRIIFIVTPISYYFSMMR
ncbi:MAG: glycosyltransferase [bacterium]